MNQTIRSITIPAALLSLSGCNILIPEDPRLGVEPEEECVARMKQVLKSSFGNEGGDAQSDEVGGNEPPFFPIFTYDVTKLGLEAIQKLSVEGTDETAGTTLRAGTNETSTAVAQFMAEPVDENGAFFLARDPALYRVRGNPVFFGGGIPAGCARQQKNMRLMSIEYTRVPKSEPEPDNAETAPQNASPQNESQ